MVKVLFAGDRHGDEEWAAQVASCAAEAGAVWVVQLGDFGFGFFGLVGDPAVPDDGAPRYPFARRVSALAVGACGGSGGQDETGDRASATTTTTAVVASADCADAGTRGATAGCLEPTQAPEYYVDQALAYFDTLDVDADPESVPDHHEDVARWEWPPWLLLTGFGRDTMITTSNLLRAGDPSTVPERDCRFFETQPFARCYVEFEYERGPCPIYEEFAFDDSGKMTFIEAWSDLDGLRPTAPDDPWAESPDFERLSTRVPGLSSSWRDSPIRSGDSSSRARWSGRSMSTCDASPAGRSPPTSRCSRGRARRSSKNRPAPSARQWSAGRDDDDDDDGLGQPPG